MLKVIARYTDKTKQKMHHTIALLFLTLDRVIVCCLNSLIKSRQQSASHFNLKNSESLLQSEAFGKNMGNTLFA